MGEVKTIARGSLATPRRSRWAARRSQRKWGMATDRVELFLVVVKTTLPPTSETDAWTVRRPRIRSMSSTRSAAHSPALRPVKAANRTCSPSTSAMVSTNATIVSADSNRARCDCPTRGDLTSSAGFFTSAPSRTAASRIVRNTFRTFLMVCDALLASTMSALNRSIINHDTFSTGCEPKAGRSQRFRIDL